MYTRFPYKSLWWQLMESTSARINRNTKNTTEKSMTTRKLRRRSMYGTMIRERCDGRAGLPHHQSKAKLQVRVTHSPPQHAAAQTRIPLVHLDATSYSLHCAIGVPLGSFVEDEVSVEHNITIRAIGNANRGMCLFCPLERPEQTKT